MIRTPFRLAAVAVLSLAALPALAADAERPALDWPALDRPRPAHLLPARTEGTPSALSGDLTWPAVATTMPAISYPARADSRPVFDPPVEAHVTAMAATRATARPAAPAQLATR